MGGRRRRRWSERQGRSRSWREGKDLLGRNICLRIFHVSGSRQGAKTEVMNKPPLDREFYSCVTSFIVKGRYFQSYICLSSLRSYTCSSPFQSNPD